MPAENLSLLRIPYIDKAIMEKIKRTKVVDVLARTDFGIQFVEFIYFLVF